MIRFVTRWCVLGTAVTLAFASAASAQVIKPQSKALPAKASVTAGELYGTIRDDRGRPLYGAVVSAIGSTQVLQVTDRDGRFAFRSLPAGEYFVRATLKGYEPPRGGYVLVTAGARQAWSVEMSRLGDDTPVMTAGVGGESTGAVPSLPGERNTSEAAWRLRRIPRGVLKETAFAPIDKDPESIEGSLFNLGRAVGSPARLASSFFADLTLRGQINLLTTTSFDRPQDLFSFTSGSPRPIAYVSLVAPTQDGDWMVRGSVTQGDISSWILAGSYARHIDATHRYEAGVSYSTQQYQGGNLEAIAAMGEGRRNVGELYGYDTWTVNNRVTLGYGGKYGNYWYLDDPSLVSGRLSISYRPSPVDPLTVRLSASHREIAPGAEEFAAPTIGPWLPPQRTFSSLSLATGLSPESVNHVEFAGEGQVRGSVVIGVRAFHQRIENQMVTLFGVAVAEVPPTPGHYHIGTAGDYSAFGWGVGVRRSLNGGVQASLEYTQFSASPRRYPAEDTLIVISPALLRREERIHDLTATLNTRVSATATRFLVVYKLNTAYADSRTMGPLADARFEVQVNQELPFLNFTGAEWEMLAGIRNIFRSDLFDGSVYDELLVVRPPKRVVGGLTVRF
ncbi:MAG TPA: TonB-dependent receptor [Vicinamibacterales bacterium]|nr:TonB-dependent receptor [Vicinamibacterales bacterium]